MKKVSFILAILLFLAGFAFFLYPEVIRRIDDRENKKQITVFENRTRQEEEEAAQPFPELREKMERYNQEIYEKGQSDLTDPFAYEKASFKLEDWGLADEMFGYVVIPKMKLELPLYLGASEENMAKGAVHLSETSIPIGGVNTNGVIAAHRGYVSGKMFQDIQLLEVGDRVSIRNLWETLDYYVIEIQIIFPEEIEKVLIREGKDMITLLTCHPYTDNTQRYVVYCEREMPSEEGSPDTEGESSVEETDRLLAERSSPAMQIERYVRIGVGLFLTLGLILWIGKGLKKRKNS